MVSDKLEPDKLEPDNLQPDVIWCQILSDTILCTSFDHLQTSYLVKLSLPDIAKLLALLKHQMQNHLSYKNKNPLYSKWKKFKILTVCFIKMICFLCCMPRNQIRILHAVIKVGWTVCTQVWWRHKNIVLSAFMSFMLESGDTSPLHTL